jgi:hypothetical protein
MTEISRRAALMHGVVALSLSVAPVAFAPMALAQDRPTTRLFKIITVRDDIVIGFNISELQEIGGADAGAVAGALKQNGTLSVWQYATKKAANGDLEQAPLRRVGLLAHDTVRVEPYATPLKVLPHE